MPDPKLGRELDKLMATEVMKWYKGAGGQVKVSDGSRDVTGKTIKKAKFRCEYDWHWYDEKGKEQGYVDDYEFCMDCGGQEDAWSPSTSIQDAWEVVEKMGDVMRRLLWNKGSGKWECIIDYDYVGVANTVPMAICLAALRAVGHES